MTSFIKFWLICLLSCWMLSPSSAFAIDTVSVSTHYPSASEIGPSPGIFKMTRSGDIATALTVNFTLGGSASRNVDYQIWETSAQFAAGADTAYVTILPINDSLSEGTETVTLTLSGGTNYILSSTQSASITIEDVFIQGLPGVFDIQESLYGMRKDIGYLQTQIINGILYLSVGMNTQIGGQINSIYIWLDTDQNPLTGDFRQGYIGSAEYRVYLSSTVGLFADYSLERLPLSFAADCNSPRVEDKCERNVLTSGAASINGNFITAAIPLNLIGNPRAVDVFATIISQGTETFGLAMNGDRIPEYGVMDSSTGKVVVRRPGKTFFRTYSDPQSDTTGLGYDIVETIFASVADQYSVELKFAQSFDPTRPAFGPGPRGAILFDSDRELLTGGIPMGTPIPSWGADGRLYFDFTTGTTLFQYSFDPTGDNVLFTDKNNDGRWFAQGNTVFVVGSQSIFDAFEKTPTGSRRIPTNGVGRASVSSIEFGPSLLDAKPVDFVPAQSRAADLANGKVVAPLAWDPAKLVTQNDPLELGPISGKDVVRVDAQVVAENLVIKGVLSTWANTDMDGLFMVALDTDMNSATGVPWRSNNGGPTIGADYFLEVVTVMGIAPIYTASLIRPDGRKTLHDALLYPQPTASAAQQGSWTVTLPLKALGQLGTNLRFYVITGTNFGELGTDVAPAQPMVMGTGIAAPGSADLVVTQIDAPDPATVGSDVTYTVTVRNAGPATASGISLTDTIPAGVSSIRCSGCAQCTFNGTNLQCPIADLAPGSSTTWLMVATTRCCRHHHQSCQRHRRNVRSQPVE